jgi:hypothetical protein
MDTSHENLGPIQNATRPQGLVVFVLRLSARFNAAWGR